MHINALCASGYEYVKAFKEHAASSVLMNFVRIVNSCLSLSGKYNLVVLHTSMLVKI